MRKLLSIFKIPELRKKIWITLLFLVVYRVGYAIPLPMLDQGELAKKMEANSSGTTGQIFNMVSMFSGGNLSAGCIFALGIMPYISASIIIQLLGASGLSPYLERLRKEPNGQRKMNDYTRKLTVFITVVQAIIWIRGFMDSPDGSGSSLTKGYTDSSFDAFFFWTSAVLILTAGTIFLMWLGEQIDEYGIGNGISLIIMAGIVCRLPDAFKIMVLDFSKPGWLPIKDSLFTLGAGTGDISFEKFLLLLIIFVGVIVGVIAMTKAQRRIPTQSAKHVRGRRAAFGATRTYLPLKVNQAGVMPVIFASSLLIFPSILFSQLGKIEGWEWARTLGDNFTRNSGWVYNMLYILMIYFFCYFWTSITFNPKEMANNLKDNGSFIPGYRPGKSTSDYLEKVLMRITYVGAAFLALVAIIPTIIGTELTVDFRIATFFGGTSLLIIVSVCLDLVQKINSHLVMRNYPGLTED